MAILVTGAAGFIGYHVAKRLLLMGETIVGLDNLNDYYDPQLKRDRLSDLGVKASRTGLGAPWESEHPNLSFYQGDVQNDIFLEKICEKHKVKSIIHLAAQAGVRYSIERPEVYVSSNVEGFFAVLEIAKKFNIKQLTYASSSSVYGMDSRKPFSEDETCDRPVSLYAATKRSNELMAFTYSHLHHLSITGLRFFTVYGPWGRPDMAPILFASAAYHKKPIKVFNHGNQSRDFTYIDDIVQGVIMVHKKGLESNSAGHRLMNIGNGSPVPLMDFIQEIEKVSGISLEKEMVEAQPGDVALTYASTAKLHAYTGYQPKVQIQEGVRKFINWFEDYYIKTEKEYVGP